MNGFDTQRLHIRPLSESDEPLYCGLYTDAETMRFIGPPLTLLCATRSFHAALRLTRRQPAKRLFFTLVHKTTLQTVGICSVQGIDASQRRAEAGIIIAPASRAHGFAAEGLSALVTRAFDVLPIDEVWVQIALDHAIVERLVISVGFSQGGEIAPTHERKAQRIWSAFRQSWLSGR